MNNKVINFILFQLGWFACVYSAASQQALLGVAIVFVLVIYHVATIEHKSNEIRIIIIAMTIGLVWDSILVALGWLSYSDGMIVDFIAPYWIVVMWGLFAMTLNHSLSWLKNKLVVAAILGFVAGPLAYYAGHKLGAVEFVQQSQAFIALAISWAIFTPLLLKLSSKDLVLNQAEAS